MKKKIIAGLGIFSLIFLATAVYTIISIESATSQMDNLIKLHQVEILREHLLIQIKRAQSDLYLKNTPYARNMDTIVNHVRSMSNILNTCFGCHHTEPIETRLKALRLRVEDYKNGLSRVFTLRSNGRRLRYEEDHAFQMGSGLIDEVDSITRMANVKLEQRTRAAFQDIRSTKAMLYVLIGVVPLAAISLSALFIRGFTRPVGELLTATRRLKSRDLEYRIRDMPDEFGEVAASFNEMAQALREDRTRMQWAEQLVVLGQMAGGLAHEIKNPLAGIKATMDVLSGDPAISRENRFLVYKVVEQIVRIDSLMKSILNFARPPKPNMMLVDLNSIFDATIALAERHPAFRARSGREVTVLKDFDQHLPDTLGDPMQLQQVFLNLLLNAADAMPDGGIVTIVTGYDHSERKLQARVTDTGKGIDEAIKGKIFQPFFTTKSNGTGLGLAIIKGLVEQHGGSISVENNDGPGASFSITLPLRTAAEAVTA